MTIITDPKHPDFDKVKFERARKLFHALTKFMEIYKEPINVTTILDGKRYKITVIKDENLQ